MKNRPLCSLCLFFCLLICIGTVLGGGKLIKELSPSAAELYLKEDEEILAAGRGEDRVRLLLYSGPRRV